MATPVKPSNSPRNAGKTTPPGGLSWQFRSRAVLLLLMIVLPAIGAVAYSGPAWAAVFYRLVVDGGMLLVWLGGAVGWGLFLLRMLKCRESKSPAALRWTTAGGLGLGMMSLAVLGLGLAGALNNISAWVLIALGWVTGAFALKMWDREAGADALTRWLKEPAGWEWLWLLATPFMMIALTSAMVPAGMLWNPDEPHGYDVAEYHLEVPREWFEGQRIVPLHHNVFSFFPFNVEMHYLLAMHLRGGPWAAMYLAQLMHIAFMALTVLAVYGFAARVSQQTPEPSRLHSAQAPGATSSQALTAARKNVSAPPEISPHPRSTPRLSAVIAGLSMLTVPWLTQLAGIAYDEGGFLLFGTLAIGWALAATFDPKNRRWRFILAGVMAGFAAGSKLTAVPEVLVAVPVVATGAALWILLRRNDRTAAKQVFAGTVLFGITGLVTFSPWLVRNQVWAHNPVFPELMPILGQGDFNDHQVHRWEAAHKPPADQQTFTERARAFWNTIIAGHVPSENPDGKLTAWQFGYVLIPGALVAFGLSIRRPQAWCLLALLLLLALFWLGFTHLQGRFFLLAAPIAALLAAELGAEWPVLWPQFAGSDRRSNSLHRVAVALLLGPLAAGMILAWWNTHDELLGKLYGSKANRTALAPVLGIESLEGLMIHEIAPDALPENVTLELVGDARAFWYPVPISRLRYRTIFNVKGDGSSGEPPSVETFVKTWTGGERPAGRIWVVIDREEIRRFKNTYRELPPVPEEIWKMKDFAVFEHVPSTGFQPVPRLPKLAE